ncbi:tRNA(Ile)(2)-agmatinylcytidine synthase [Methanoplanus endosymbiosus]|uniref:tRNA(Ile2) 2-agmatinylcytidine synthetase TiaS n=1 Tax=Methanoplanus endosymbiosus TaxID=33865 RepID=A0A9E7PK59_9EURY|nr:tRNA(Ile)(2)-agmatinylcytidine synthase [Methanoplanus endosymbiosus]UUX91255.1 tRNA(Ile)(2)-agmatinylcytidine synthase [Methanoplanus endosymbiosus]
MIFRLGLDDTDSPEGMCTTYLASVLSDKLRSEGITVKELLLVRLNPNVKFKTRGNAAVCLICEGDLDCAFDTACIMVEKYADFGCGNTNPGVVAVAEDARPGAGFYLRALRDFCTIDGTVGMLDKIPADKVRYRGWKNKRGLIGASASVAAELGDCSDKCADDCTYELLVYRDPEDKGMRYVDRESLFEAEEKTYPHTWDSVDTVNNAVVCVPHTPDPVIYGIRGESPEWLQKADSYIISQMPERSSLFRTNQGTDAHLTDADAGDIEDGKSYRISGKVFSSPESGPGGHVSFMLEGMDGSPVRCMAYEPTKNFRNIIRALIPGDLVRVCGSFKGGSINLEKIEVTETALLTEEKPPVCVCGKRMTSAGSGKGYKCRKCSEKSMVPEITVTERNLSPGWYEVPPVARRHLSKPLIRGKFQVFKSNQIYR